MAKYRHALPQRNGGIFLTDGGMETTLVFHEASIFRISLPSCCWTDDTGRQELKRYFAAIFILRVSTAPASCSTRRHGAPTPIGARGSAMTRRRSRRSTSPSIAS